MSAVNLRLLSAVKCAILGSLISGAAAWLILFVASIIGRLSHGAMGWSDDVLDYVSVPLWIVMAFWWFVLPLGAAIGSVLAIVLPRYHSRPFVAGLIGSGTAFVTFAAAATLLGSFTQYQLQAVPLAFYAAAVAGLLSGWIAVRGLWPNPPSQPTPREGRG